MNKKDIFSFLQSRRHTVIATVDEANRPESALIGFGQTEQLELIFGTSNTSRKYLNIMQNNNVSFVIGWEDDGITIQYEGIAAEIFGEEREKMVALYHTKVPGAAVFKDLPDQAYFKVTPKWIRCSDFSTGKPEIVEFNL